MRHLLSELELEPGELVELAERAIRLRADPPAPHGTGLAGRVLALLFFNPSLRTRLSMESAMARLGGHASVLTPGADTWRFEEREGVVMDGAFPEHIREAAAVVGRMAHAVGVRASQLVTGGAATAEVTTSYEELATDRLMRAIAQHADRPVINLESNTCHPMQGLADMAAMRGALGETRGRKYVLTWTWHPKALPVATPHSQLLSAAHLGMDVTLLRPEGFGLDPSVVAAAGTRAEAAGGSLTETDDVAAAFDGAAVVCAKSWGALDLYGRWDEERERRTPLREEWIVDGAKMARTDDARFLHCLPVRRGVVVTDEVLDGPRALHLDAAEMRLWTAMAVLRALLG